MRASSPSSPKVPAGGPPLKGSGPLDLLRRAFTENLGLKLASLAAAIVLFSVVRGAEDAQRSVFVDVVALLPAADSGKILVSELPDQVKLTLQGSRSLLNSVRREELETLQIDLRDTSLRYYYFEPTAFEVPAGVSVVQLAPASIPLRWAERVERKLPVSVTLTGVPKKGFALAEGVTPQPKTMRVRGAQNEVDHLDAVATQPLDIGGLGAGVHERRVRLERAPPHASYGGSATIDVRFEIVPEIEVKTLVSVPIEVVGPPARIRPRSVDLVLRGPPEKLERLDATRVVPWVDGSQAASAGTSPVAIQVRGLSDSVEVVSVEPNETLLTAARR